MGLLDLVFPRICVGCEKPGSYICNSCIVRLSKIKQKCPECDKPSIDGITHVKCEKKLGLSGLITLWSYNGVIRNAILSFKYKYASEVGKEFSELVVRELLGYKIVFPVEPILIPIPLHWYRENFRGFNQSLELSSVISKFFGWRLIPDLLVREKTRTPQALLKRTDRIKNVQGIFVFNKKYNQSALKNKNYIIFDDVYTTGSTIKEACKVLKRKGARSVWSITVAR